MIHLQPYCNERVNAVAPLLLGIDEVATAIGDANVNLPTGTLDGAKQTFTIEANGPMFQAAAYRQMVVAYRDGSPVRLEELGKIIDSVENTKTAEGTSFAEMKLHQEAVAAVIAKDPNIDGFMSSIGGGGGSNTGRFFMRLKPRCRRSGFVMDRAIPLVSCLRSSCP